MDFDVLAFIGRFQPFHKGHESVIRTGLSRAKKVAVVIGSSEKPRSARNPFTTRERMAMITSVFPDEVADGQGRRRIGTSTVGDIELRLAER